MVYPSLEDFGKTKNLGKFNLAISIQQIVQLNSLKFQITCNFKLISSFSTVKKSPGLQSTFAAKQKFREDLKRVKSLSRELLEKRNAEKEAKKQRRKENIQRRKENESKAEILQVVSNLINNMPWVFLFIDYLF